MYIQEPIVFSRGYRDGGYRKGFSFTSNLEKTNEFSAWKAMNMTKESIKEAIEREDIDLLAEYSKKAYGLSGRYAKIVNSGANLFKYDYFVIPFCKKQVKKELLISTFYDVLLMLEQFNPKMQFKEWGLKVLRDGSYYGYKKGYDESDNLIIQELPRKYCLSVFKFENRDLVHFNLAYFIDCFPNYSEEIRESVVRSFPDEIVKGYERFKNNQVPLSHINGRTGYWITLDPKRTVHFSMEEGDKPYFIQVLSALINFEDSTNLVKKRYKNSLNAILANEFPMKKQADVPLVDIRDMRDFNDGVNNELEKRTEGIFSVSTLANTKLLSNNSTGNASEGEKILTCSKDDIYDEAGMSHMQFNSENSVALQYSIKNDEGNLSRLKDQFEQFLNDLVKEYLMRRKIKGLSGVVFKVEILNTTCYNYIELSDKYKERTQLGYSKVLTQVALGHSQLSVLSVSEFENKVLDLVNKFIPPMMSSTMSGNQITEKKNGRPESENPSEKTLQNKKSQEKEGNQA